MTPAEKAKQTKWFKGEVCGKCVYECKDLPWRHEDRKDDCYVTDEMVLNSIEVVSEHDMAWMAHFCIAGEHHRGRGWEIGWGPESFGSMRTKGLSPPFIEKDDVPLDEYLSRSGIRMPLFDDICQKVFEAEEDFLKRSLFTLMWMGQSMRFDHRFYNHTQDNGRFSSNEVLAITFSPDDEMITVLSDTRASNTIMNISGNWSGEKGESIRPFNRPRFKTEYENPYYEDLAKFAGATPGSRRDECKMISRLIEQGRLAA
jgi:hypothetical protein